MHYKIIINQDNIIINSIFKKNRSLFNSISIKINKRNIKYYKYLNGHIYIKLINENEYIIPEIYFTKKDIDIILKYFKLNNIDIKVKKVTNNLFAPKLFKRKSKY